MILPHGDKPIYDGTKKWNSKVCQYCSAKFRDGQDVAVMPMELKGAHRSFEFVFCLSGGTFRCVDFWRTRYDVVKGTNFDIATFCNGQCHKDDPGHELAEI